jgi:hypothetical protein
MGHEVQDVQANVDGGAENTLAAVLLLWSGVTMQDLEAVLDVHMPPSCIAGVAGLQA